MVDWRAARKIVVGLRFFKAAPGPLLQHRGLCDLSGQTAFESPSRAAEDSGRPVGVCDVYKEQTPLPLHPEPHPLDFTADVSVFKFGTPDKKPVWI